MHVECYNRSYFQYAMVSMTSLTFRNELDRKDWCIWRNRSFTIQLLLECVSTKSYQLFQFNWIHSTHFHLKVEFTFFQWLGNQFSLDGSPLTTFWVYTKCALICMILTRIVNIKFIWLVHLQTKNLIRYVTLLLYLILLPLNLLDFIS